MKTEKEIQIKIEQIAKELDNFCDYQEAFGVIVNLSYDYAKTKNTLDEFARWLQQ